MDLRFVLIILMAFVCADASAQFWKRKKKKAETENVVQHPNSLDPSTSAKKQYIPKESRRSAKGPTYGLEQEFYERMEQVAKDHRKAEKLMQKPQYSDPMYFGHKRPPKKRKPSKMKYCKECGIRH